MSISRAPFLSAIFSIGAVRTSSVVVSVDVIHASSFHRVSRIVVARIFGMLMLVVPLML